MPLIPSVRLFTKLAGRAIAFLALTLSLLIWGHTSPALAAPCYTVEDHEICILDIRRSAKNYWEYRAAVSVDGVARSLEVYNCRDRIRITREGRRIPFSQDPAGAIVCRLYRG